MNRIQIDVITGQSEVIELTAEERARAFGDAEWPNRDTTARIKEMCLRYKTGLALSKSDVKEVKKYLKGN